MDKKLHVVVADRAFGSLLHGSERLITVNDKEIGFSTLLGGEWPERWKKKDIRITRDRFTWVYRVKFGEGTNKNQVISTYTKKIYYRKMLPLMALTFLFIAIFSQSIPAIYSLLFLGVLTGMVFFVQYLPYHKLGKLLKAHNYIS